ncbi:hypothetical protein AVEN_225359-1 [Araneus ventricosus]|uniref:Uncharacterized protein n=1 Tax=Araneus ventricosus TaxID=182803 RepID=A0A4Y2ALD9_ARAVE|nr:hypothetical protein AVEN_225359-1 [Araneus ventricosus]
MTGKTPQPAPHSPNLHDTPSRGHLTHDSRITDTRPTCMVDFGWNQLSKSAALQTQSVKLRKNIVNKNDKASIVDQTSKLEACVMIHVHCPCFTFFFNPHYYR